MYVRFEIEYRSQLEYLKNEITDWAHKNNIRFQQKTVKNHHKLTFDNDQHYSSFALTWRGPPFEIIDSKKY
jgi:hypothetical protein